MMKFKFNLPNNITLIRVLLIPVFVLVLIADTSNRNLFSALVFGLLSISDVLDGYVARKKKQVTDFGKLIDPIADKLLISTALILLVGHGVDFWMAACIIAREVVLTGVRIYLIPWKIVIPASNFGKSKTVIQSLAIVFVLLQLPYSWHVMLIAVFLTLFSGFEYLYRIRKMTGDKIVNTPNMITLARFLLIIPFVHSFLNGEFKSAIAIFATIAISDKLDGISARMMNQQTELGSGFDSFTDWSLILMTFILFILVGVVSPFHFFLLAIPASVSGIMKMIHTKKLKKVPVIMPARLSVGMLYVTITLLLTKLWFGTGKLDGTIDKMMLITIFLVYVAMAGYVLKIISLPKKKSKMLDPD